MQEHWPLLLGGCISFETMICFHMLFFNLHFFLDLFEREKNRNAQCNTNCLAKPVAVKIIKNPKDVNNQVMLNEAHILDWKHPNIIKIFKVSSKKTIIVWSVHIRILQIESTPNFAIVIMERFNGDCLQNTLNSMEVPVIHRIQ